MLSYCLIATSFGPIGLAWSDTGLRRLQLPGGDRRETAALLLAGIEAGESHPPDWLAETVVRLQGYFRGQPVELAGVPLDLAGVPAFRQRLYAEMLRLGWGETVSYGELAARVGLPGAAQSVGSAMGRNPVPVIVPCHRVLASNGRPGGFSAPGGVATKLRLLAMEGVSLGRRDPAQMAFAF